MKWFFLIFLIFSSFRLDAQQEIKKEKEILEVINDLRRNPSLFLETVVMPFLEENQLKRNFYTQSLIRDLKKQYPLPILSIDSSLQKMAQEFAIKLGEKGSFGHLQYKKRYNKYGSHLNTDGENIQYGLQDPLKIVMDLLIDQGVQHLGHRKNLLSEDFSVVGIGYSRHKRMKTMTVMAFGGF